MKPRIHTIAWLCSAIALSLTPMKAQEAKPVDQPAAALPPAQAPKVETAPPADAPPKVEAPLTTEEFARLALGASQDNRGLRTDAPGQGPRDGRRDGHRGPVNPMPDGHRDGHHQRGEAPPQGHPQHGRDQAGRSEGFRQHQGPGPRGNERGGFQPKPLGRGPQHFAQRGSFGAPRGRESLRPHQGGPREGQMYRGGEGRGDGRFGSGPGRGFDRPGAPQHSRPRLGGGFANPRSPQPRFEHRDGPGPEHFEQPKGEHQPGMHGGDHGPGPASRDGGPRFAPPMNHQRGRGPSPFRTV